MGVTERKEREKAEMKKAILRTATEMYLKEGFENLSIRAIANRMEYAVGTMYRYYKDRAELIQALMEEGFKKMIKAFNTVKQDQDSIARLEKIMLKYLDFAFKNPEYYELMLIISKPSGINVEEKSWENGLAAFQILIDSINDCIKHNQLKYTDAQTASLHIWSFLHGLVCLHLKKHLTPLGDPDQNFLENSTRQFVETIRV